MRRPNDRIIDFINDRLRIMKEDKRILYKNVDKIGDEIDRVESLLQSLELEKKSCINHNFIYGLCRECGEEEK